MQPSFVPAETPSNGHYTRAFPIECSEEGEKCDGKTKGSTNIHIC